MDEQEFCFDCPLLDRQYIAAEGEHDAKILIVGTAPGAAEEESGKIFAGRSGELLRTIVTDLGLSDRVYYTNVIKRRPCQPRPNREECFKCGGHLTGEVVRNQPRIIVTLGYIPTQFFLGNRKSVKDIRGLPFPVRKFHIDMVIVPTYDPSFVLRRGGLVSDVGDQWVADLEEVKAIRERHNV